ncbi:uncharacterized protein LOC117890496 [Drosophila subobscura]|uniref:uncharacterized protein LOC117890496 n=1 Tax=Drosophila subobscura TaxID=7241 RepID=UPI00155A2A03|nr:uncharacterized protein LOC117890496 [Drosophila subobscura]
MLLHFVGFWLLLSVCLLHVASQENSTVAGNATETKIIMVRQLHKKDEQKKDLLNMVIHKVLPGDPYYRVFDGDQAKARSYTNKIWQRLLNRYDSMLI